MSDQINPLIGLSDFHYAILDPATDTKDTPPEWGTPVPLSGAISANYNPNSNLAILFADDGAAVAADTIGEIDLELSIADLSQEDHAALFGHTISDGCLIEKPTDQSPYIAFGFKALRSNGAYSYIWLHKGKFSKPGTSHATKGATINFQTPTFASKFVKSEYYGTHKFSTRTDAASFNPTRATNWFTAVQTASSDNTAPTVSVVPADGASSIAISANVVWTFSKPIRVSSVNGSNFMLLKSDGTAVAASLSLGTGNTVVTLDPSVNLSAASDYIAVATSNVMDVAGNKLSANSVTNFTTA